jgi:hypothetical protein
VRDFARRYGEAWGSHDPAQVASYYEPAGTIAINGGPPTPIVDAANGFISAFPDIQVFMDDLIFKDEEVEFRWTFTGTIPVQAVLESRCGSPDSKSGRAVKTASSGHQGGTTTRPSTTASWSREPRSRSRTFHPIRADLSNRVCTALDRRDRAAYPVMERS